MLKLTVNDRVYDVDVEPEMPLLWVLRDHLNLPGTKYGCGISVCGACTVHVDGAAVRSCMLAVSDAVGKKIVTIEGLSSDGLHRIQKAWIEHQVPQCGYCQPGMLMTVAGAMKAGHHGSEISSELKNLCVCGTYPRIKKAIAKL